MKSFVDLDPPLRVMAGRGRLAVGVSPVRFPQARDEDGHCKWIFSVEET